MEAFIYNVVHTPQAPGSAIMGCGAAVEARAADAVKTAAAKVMRGQAGRVVASGPWASETKADYRQVAATAVGTCAWAT